VPRFDMGYRAVDMLIRAVNGEAGPMAPVDLGYELVERQTTRQLA
jgi:LacI family gluconate utilization system Gnt-I transcriptional repressor